MKSIEGYEVFEEISRNDRWVDWDAIELRFNRPVVLRQILAQSENDDTNADKILKALESLARQNHGNVMRVFAVDHQGGWAAIEKLNALPSLAVAPVHYGTVLKVLRQLLAGLECFHRQGLVHGCLQSDSIRIDDSGTAKLCDSEGFPIASELPLAFTKTKHQAPELLDGDVYGRFGLSSDIYCLGMCLLEFAMGASFDKLFRGIPRNRRNDQRAWAAWHASNESMGSIEKQLSGWPEPLIAIFRKMVAKHVQDRFTNASEVLKALDDVSIASPRAIEDETCGASSTIENTTGTKVYLGTVFGSKAPEVISQPDLVTVAVDYWKNHLGVKTKVGLGGVVALLIVVVCFLSENVSKQHSDGGSEPQNIASQKNQNSSSNLTSTEQSGAIAESEVSPKIPFCFDVSPKDAIVEINNQSVLSGEAVVAGEEITIKVSHPGRESGYASGERKMQIEPNTTYSLFLHTSNNKYGDGLAVISNQRDKIDVQLRGCAQDDESAVVSIQHGDKLHYLKLTKEASAAIESFDDELGVLRLENLRPSGEATVSASKAGVCFRVSSASGSKIGLATIAVKSDASLALTSNSDFSKSPKIVEIKDDCSEMLLGIPNANLALHGSE